MDWHGSSTRPKALLISRCIPDPLGHPARLRAWQLLKLLSQRFDVYLACLYDQPYNLAQWRCLQALTADLHIDRPGIGVRVARRLGSMKEPLLADRHQAWRQLLEPVTRWTQTQPFHSVVCTSASLWPLAEFVQDAMRIADLRSALELDRPLHVGSMRFGSASTRFHRDLTQLHAKVARRAHMVLVGDADQARRYEFEADQCVVLPESVHPGDVANRMPHEPALRSPVPKKKMGLLLAHGGRDDVALRCRQWFIRRVWPGIARSQPQLALSVLHSRRMVDPAEQFQRATLVVAPNPSPLVSRSFVWQSLAVGKPIIMADPVLTELNLLRGHHAHSANDPAVWIEVVRTMADSLSKRADMADHGFKWAQQQSRVDQWGQQMLNHLVQPRFDPDDYAEAA